jgi:LPXTG-motif cell wall-anchored protein
MLVAASPAIAATSTSTISATPPPGLTGPSTATATTPTVAATAPAKPKLPQTGWDVMADVLVAAGALGTGAALRFASRTR